MPGAKEVLAIGTATALIAGCGGASNRDPSHHRSGDGAAAVGLSIQAEAQEYCSEPPFTLMQYAGEVGVHAMPVLSYSVDSSGKYVFNSSDPNVVGKEIARELGRDNLAAALVYTVEDVTKSNANPSDIATDATTTFNQMQPR